MYIRTNTRAWHKGEWPLPYTLAPTHIVSLEHRNVEGEQLQRDDREDALYAVHCARDRDTPVGALQTRLIIALADDDGAALQCEGTARGS